MPNVRKILSCIINVHSKTSHIADRCILWARSEGLIYHKYVNEISTYQTWTCRRSSAGRGRAAAAAAAGRGGRSARPPRRAARCARTPTCRRRRPLHPPLPPRLPPPRRLRCRRLLHARDTHVRYSTLTLQGSFSHIKNNVNFKVCRKT